SHRGVVERYPYVHLRPGGNLRQITARDGLPKRVSYDNLSCGSVRGGRCPERYFLEIVNHRRLYLRRSRCVVSCRNSCTFARGIAYLLTHVCILAHVDGAEH